MPTRSFPPALAHGPVKEVMPGIHVVTGTVSLPAPLPLRISRNMTIVRQGERVVLVNSVRLDDAGLAALDALGRVTDVIRLAANHGMDDPFYRDRYGAKVWAVKGQRYTAGFDTSAKETYFTPDIEMDEHTSLPLTGAKLYVIHSQPPEGLLLLEQHGGICVAGDCLQHWPRTDEHFNFLGALASRILGFVKPYNIGPAWLKGCKPPKSELRGILDLGFAQVLPAHGQPVLGDAVQKYRAAILRVT